MKLFGAVHKLIRGEHEIEGQVTFKVDMDGKSQSVSATLDQRTTRWQSMPMRYATRLSSLAILERVKQRWRMTVASVRELVSDDDEDDAM